MRSRRDECYGTSGNDNEAVVPAGSWQTRISLESRSDRAVRPGIPADALSQ